MSKYGYIDNFHQRRNLFLAILGLHELNQPFNYTQILYNIYLAFLIFTALCYFFGEVFIIKETKNNLSQLLCNVEMFGTHLIGILKFYILAFKKDKIKALLEPLESDKYKYKPYGEFKPYKIYNEESKKTHIICNYIMALYLMVGGSAHITSLVDFYSTNYDPDNDVLNRTCKDFVPYYCYIPYEFKTTLECHFLFALTNLQLGIFAAYIAAHDMTYATIINCLKTNMIILSGAFSSIRPRVLIRLGLPPEYTIFKDENYPVLEAEMYKEVKHCTKHLMLLIGVYDELENLFSKVILSQTLISLMVFASCLYSATSTVNKTLCISIVFCMCLILAHPIIQVPLMSPIFFSQLEYFSAVLSQFILFCWFGNEMALSSDNVQSHIFQCDWLSASKRFKRCLILNHNRLQRSLFLSIGKFSPLQLATMISVVKASFSYFAVFRSID